MRQDGGGEEEDEESAPSCAQVVEQGDWSDEVEVDDSVSPVWAYEFGADESGEYEDHERNYGSQF